MLTLGCDPEIFLEDATASLVSSIGIVGGSKYNPKPLPLGPGFAVQEDNVALEFNIPPARNSKEYVEYIRAARTYLQGEMYSLGLSFSKLSAATWPENQLQHPDAQQFGCTPDFDAWRNGRRNPRPRATNKNLRSCGGHVHVGTNFQNRNEILTFVKYMDLFLGVPSVLLDPGDLRKQLYGRAGAFRYTTYGVEYRVLSNYWIFEDALVSWVWSQTEKAVSESRDDHTNIENIQDCIIQAINSNNKQQAKALISEFKITLPNDSVI